MIFDKIERVAIGVRDLDKTRDFYSSLLGIKFDEPLLEDRLKLRAAYSSFGLELVEATAPDTVLDKFVKRRGEGIFCIVIKVTNLNQAIKIFEEHGLHQAGKMQYGNLKEVAFHPNGAHGVQIVLAEYVAKHPATVAAMGK